MKIEYKRNINKEVIMREEVFDYLMSIYHNYKKTKEVLDKIKEYIKENSKNISITPNSVKAVPVEYILELLEGIE